MSGRLYYSTLSGYLDMRLEYGRRVTSIQLEQANVQKYPLINSKFQGPYLPEEELQFILRKVKKEGGWDDAVLCQVKRLRT